jgi:ubiquinone/menaquinone biosynthesis C-methylase UbiE
MSKFKKYSEYYDKIYKDKNYESEVDFVDKAIKKFAGENAHTILSLGCGTCNHDILLAKKGYSLTSVDESPSMLKIARKKIANKKLTNKIKLVEADIRKMTVTKEHDVVLAMFNVISYFVANTDIDRALASISKGLKAGGYFMFDCWFAPAVLKDRPGDRVKEITKGKQRLLRLTTSKLNLQDNSIDINFKVLDIFGNKLLADVNETHSTRFWSRPELEYIFGNNGFKIVKICNFMDLNSEISENNWNIFAVAQKTA